MNYLGDPQPPSVLPPFDLMDLTCSTNNRQKLSKIYKAVQSAKSKRATARRIRFPDALTTSAYDPNRGVYTPLSDFIYLTGKLQSPLELYPAFTLPL